MGNPIVMEKFSRTYISIVIALIIIGLQVCTSFVMKEMLESCDAYIRERGVVREVQDYPRLER